MAYSQSYNLFFRFLDEYGPRGFSGINPEDPLMQELEEMMEDNNQFFFIGDFIQLKILYTSKRSFQMMGIESEKINPYDLFEATHPDDLMRHSLGRAKMVKLSHDIFIAGKGTSLLSSNLKMRNTSGSYTSVLIQCYIYFTAIPYKTVMLLQIHTDIEWSKSISKKFHYNISDDLSYFRYPDEKMLALGLEFTLREFEIIKLAGMGFNTHQIAEKLFLSHHTISTHRRNILKKTGSESIPNLYINLQEMGIM